MPRSEEARSNCTNGCTRDSIGRLPHQQKQAECGVIGMGDCPAEIEPTGPTDEDVAWWTRQSLGEQVTAMPPETAGTTGSSREVGGTLSGADMRPAGHPACRPTGLTDEDLLGAAG